MGFFKDRGFDFHAWDKTLHFVVAFLMYVSGYHATSLPSWAIVGIVSVLIFGKEYYDKKVKGTGWDWYDILWGFLGMGGGILMTGWS